MTIAPDDKDWTWVIEAQCPECGFDASAMTCAEVADQLRAAIVEWRTVLMTRDDIGDRPRADVWSPLEYGCHVRDVFRIYVGRVRRMLDEDAPHYDNWDQDKTAVEDHYDQQDPSVVAGELAAEGTKLADLFAAIAGDQWQRTGFRSDGAAFTVDTISRYFLHDVVHHLVDVKA
ncbi:MAG TPA: DinB family protein [Acidimicrobiales bacterium]|nr:DinB family protein [Acidimicrobiales bacterium]